MEDTNRTRNRDTIQGKATDADKTPAVTRRDFVRTAAAAAVAAPFVAGGVIPSALGASVFSGGFYAGGSDRIRVGLVGCGGRGTGAAADAMQADKGAVLVAMADLFRDKVDACYNNLKGAIGDKLQVNEDHKFTGFDAYRQLLNSGVDMVILATTCCFRPVQLAACIDAGKHVFCEKPMSVDGPGVRSILESTDKAKAKNLSLVAGFCWRYNLPEQETFRQILKEGRIGEVVSVNTQYNTTGWVDPKPRKSGWTDTEYQLRNWHFFHPMSGDHIVEQGCHSIDKILWAMGGRTPQKCFAVGGRNLRTMGNVYDNFSVTFEYEDGARAFHMCRQWANTPFDNNDYIIGTKGNCFINGWAPLHVIKGENPWTFDEKTPHENMYKQEHDDLFASIRSGNHINDGIRMAHATLMAVMARQAAYTGEVVTWDGMLNSQENLVPEKWTWGDWPFPAVPKPGITKFL